MITISYSSKFLRQLKKLEPALKDEAKIRINLFKSQISHSTLKVHKLHGKLDDCWAFSINYKYRIVFEYVSENEANLLAIDDHDIYK